MGVDGGEIACHAIRYIFNNKNLDVSEVPVSPRQGKCNILVDFTYKYWQKTNQKNFNLTQWS